MYVAHIREKDLCEQSLKTHLLEVKELCEQIGEKLNMPNVFGIAGLLHDVGKYSDEFQAYLRAAIADPKNPPKRGSVNHSTAGGLLLNQRYLNNKELTQILIEMIANAIYAHHGQLYDFVDAEGESPYLARASREDIPLHIITQRFFLEVMTEQELEDYFGQACKQFLGFLKNKLEKADRNEINFKIAPKLTMLIYSALIDADRTNSRQFDENIQLKKDEDRTLQFQSYMEKLETNLAELQKNAKANEITALRQKMSDNCLHKATLPTGVYTLSIPTGGGKTLASLRFALKHAVHHKLDRIIYIVPFTTIIEQNVQVVRKQLQTDKVLEHHSNVMDTYKTPQNYEELMQLRQLHQAKDNFDAPIIFTTMVQYLNTFYSGKSRNLRRLHNLANSVIIFDEVQSVPIQCVSLFNESVNFLTKYANCTAVLCTATQPALQHVQQNLKVDGEIIENLPVIEQAFKRTKIVLLNERDEWTTAHLAEFIEQKLNEVKSLLIITNNKKTTRQLFEKCRHMEHVYHLSTGMCPTHRKSKLEEMRNLLAAGKAVLCISTQLIEAGVDISFDCVMRSLAGIDSIAQAAGRCNRHGEATIQTVYVFKHAEENLTRLPTIAKGQRNACYLLKDIEERGVFDGEVLSTAAITHYFKQYYSDLALELNFPVKNLPRTLYELLFTPNKLKKSSEKVCLHAAFRTVANHFEVIEANTEPILVPYDYGKDLITQLTSYEKVDYKHFLKEAQQYSVNVFKHELHFLQQNGLIRQVDFGVVKLWIAFEQAYDENYGLSVQGEAAMSLMDF